MKLEKKGQREIYELAFTRKNGQKIPMNISPTPLFDEKGHYEGSLAIMTDISEKKQLEDQLRQSQKMEAVATLAGGIAHDFNIILASIIGYAELTEQDVADNAPARENLEEVQRGGYRARDQVKQILTFSRQVENANGSPSAPALS